MPPIRETMKSLPMILCFILPSFALGVDDRADIQPLLENYCVRCHGPEKQKGDVRLDRLTVLDSATFEAVYEQLADGLMPPDDQRQPATAERKTLMQHVLELAKKDSAVTASGLRRLNKREYANTVRDLLGLHKGTFDPGEYIYDDEVDEGFDTAADSLVISNELLMEYMDAADKSLRHALFTSDTSRPNAGVMNVNVGRMKGVGGSRYINNGKNHIVCRSGGKAMVYDGQSTRTMQIPGRYSITVTAAGIDRDTYPVRFTPAEGPLIMGFGVKQDAAASVSVKAQLLKTFELKDNVDQTFSFDVWIDKDHFPYFSFANGSSKPITQVRSNIRRRKIDPSEMRKPYRGPGIRISEFRVEGPFLDEWPPASIRTTYDSDEIPDLADPAARKEVVVRFANRAFRRNVTEAEVAPYLKYLNEQRIGGILPPQNGEDGPRQDAADTNWHDATIRTFAAMMSSVDFLYIREDKGELDAYELASRLSYFLWSTMPDAELFALAKSGKLKAPAILRQQITRLLDDERSMQFSNSFTSQWLSLDKLGSMPPDAKTKEFRPYYKDNLEAAMLEETRLFFRHVLQDNRSVRDFIDSDYSFVNPGLARLYGLPVVDFARSPSKGNDLNDRRKGKGIPANSTTDGFVRVTFPSHTKRGGLLGHGSILTLTANGVETSPVERGVWVLADFLGTPPPPPPKEVPAITPDLNGAETVRDLLEKHRSDKACMECHRRMDPLGFALEAYDPIGRLRTRYSRTQSVSTRGIYLGKDFADVTELKQILASDVRHFARNLVIRIAEYAKGRSLVAADYGTVESILDEAANNDFRLKSIVIAIATSELMIQR